MFKIPLDAKVSCTDGHAGTSIAVTLDPLSMAISHLVVEDNSGSQRLVPLNKVTETTHDEIWLACLEDELKELPLFLVTEFVERADQQSGDWAEEEGEWEDGVDVSSFEQTDEAFGMPVQVEHIPEGEVSFHRSTELEATDGHIGKVEMLIIEPESKQITHMVLRKGHLWGKKDILIPMTAVEDIDYDTVYLNVDETAVEEFPLLSDE